MSADVFVSYCRTSSARWAIALHDALGKHRTFLDTADIPLGEHFPTRLGNALLSARVVVIFADAPYFRSWYCRKELALALSPGESAVEHIVLALVPGTELGAVPSTLALTNWPTPDDTAALVALVDRRLSACRSSIGDRLPAGTLTQLRRMLEQASVRPPAPFGAIPLVGAFEGSLGERFVGRGDDLARLHLMLGVERAGASPVTCWISGMTGVGKTRFALEYVHRYAARWFTGGVFWMDAASEDGMTPQFRRVLRALGDVDPALDTAGDQAVAHAFAERLRASATAAGPVLCVVDGVPASEPSRRPRLSSWCPAIPHVWALLTSDQRVPDPQVKSFRLDPLPASAAALLLADNVPHAADVPDDQWERAAAWLGHLPVLVDGWNRALQGGSVTPPELLRRVADPDTVHQLFAPLPRGSHLHGSLERVARSVLRAFDSLDEIAQSCTALMAWFGPEPLPADLFESSPLHMVSADVRSVLLSHHFLIGATASSMGSLHPVIAAVLRRATADHEDEGLTAAAMLLVHLFSEQRIRDAACWPSLDLCKPHAVFLIRTCRRRLDRAPEVAFAGAQLGSHLGALYLSQGSSADARDAYSEAYEVSCRTRGPHSQAALACRNGFGLALLACGQTSEACTVFEELLRIQTELAGREEPGTVVTAHNYALALADAGDVRAARDIHEQNVEIRLRRHGEAHPQTLISMRHLVSALARTGELQRAGELADKVARLCEQALGADHQETLTAFQYVAETRARAGDLPGAVALTQQLVDRAARSLGKSHPVTLTLMEQLADTFAETGNHEEARALRSRRARIMIDQFGRFHPHVFNATIDFADSLGALGEHEQAISLLSDVIDRACEHLDDEHAVVLRANERLANIYREVGYRPKALAIEEDLLRKMERIHGPESPPTVTIMHNLALTLGELGRHDDSIALLEKVLASSKRIFGEHAMETLRVELALADPLRNGPAGRRPEVQSTLERLHEEFRRRCGDCGGLTLSVASRLAGLAERSGDFERATKLLQDVLARRTSSQGRDHPDTLAAMNSLGRVLAQQGDDEAAARLADEVATRARRTFSAGDSRTQDVLQAQRTLRRSEPGLAAVPDTASDAKVPLKPKASHAHAATTDAAIRSTLTYLAELASFTHPSEFRAEVHIPPYEQAQELLVMSVRDRLVDPEFAWRVWVQLDDLYASGVADAHRLKATERALPVFREFDGDGPFTGRLLYNLGTLLGDAGHPDRAVDALREAVPIIERWSQSDPDTMAHLHDALGGALTDVARFDEAQAAYLKALAIATSPPGTKRTNPRRILHNLSRVHSLRGHWDEAARVQRHVLETFPEAERTAGPYTTAMGTLANTLQHLGRIDEAGALLDRALEMIQRELGPDAVEAGYAMSRLAEVRILQNARDEAAAVYEKALSIFEARLGPNHDAVAKVLTDIGTLETTRGAYDRAEQSFTRAIDIRERVLGPDHPDLAATLACYGELLSEQRRYDEAKALLDRSLRIDQTAFGPESAQAATMLFNIGYVLMSAERYSEAADFLWRSFRIRQRVAGPNSDATIETRRRLMIALQQAGQHDEALALCEVELETAETVYGPDAAPLAEIRYNLGVLAEGAGDLGRAAQEYERSLDICRQHEGSHLDAFVSSAEQALAAVRAKRGEMEGT